MKSSFYPHADLTDKSNYKKYDIIKRDGSVLERVFLNIPIPSLREKIICFQYLSRRVKFFNKETVGFNIISRDNPWDFKVDFSSGELFNVEITSIAEDSGIFEMLKREERLALNLDKKEIELHELEKLNYFFPNNDIKKLIDALKTSGTNKTDLSPNPWYDEKLLTIGRINDERSELSTVIKTAVEKKEEKKHSEKGMTVLIIDNRSFTYEIADVFLAREQIHDFIQNCSFAEVWFYTGYYSSLDGQDAEFNLYPMKLTDEQEQLLLEYANKNPPNEDGLIPG